MPGTIAHALTSRGQRQPEAQGQPGLHIKLQASQDYLGKPRFKKLKNKSQTKKKKKNKTLTPLCLHYNHEHVFKLFSQEPTLVC